MLMRSSASIPRRARVKLQHIVLRVLMFSDVGRGEVSRGGVQPEKRCRCSQESNGGAGSRTATTAHRHEQQAAYIAYRTHSLLASNLRTAAEPGAPTLQPTATQQHLKPRDFSIPPHCTLAFRPNKRTTAAAQPPSPRPTATQPHSSAPATHSAHIQDTSPVPDAPELHLTGAQRHAGATIESHLTAHQQHNSNTLVLRRPSLQVTGEQRQNTHITLAAQYYQALHSYCWLTC